METKRINIRFSVLAGLILLAAFSRIVPHMPNFSSLAAIGLFGAAYFSKKWQAFLIPLAATLLSDIFLNNMIYKGFSSYYTILNYGFYWQYGSYILITFSGRYIFNKVTPVKVLIGALGSTVIFYLVSNFGCFLFNPIYPPNLGGMITCYISAIPFLNGTLLGNLFYSAVLFGSFALLEQRFPVLRHTYQGNRN